MLGKNKSKSNSSPTRVTAVRLRQHNDNERGKMKEYRVSIWTSVNIQADNEKQAEETAHNQLINGAIKFREFEFNAEERD